MVACKTLKREETFLFHFVNFWFLRVFIGEWKIYLLKRKVGVHCMKEGYVNDSHFRLCEEENSAPTGKKWTSFFFNFFWTREIGPI